MLRKSIKLAFLLAGVTLLLWIVLERDMIVDKGMQLTSDVVRSTSNLLHRNITLRKQDTVSNASKITDKYDDVTQVFEWAYYRGGSTYFSQVFDENPEAFYILEPLHIYHKQYLVEDLKKHPKNEILRDEWFTKVTTIFHNLFRCQLSEVPRKILTHGFQRRNKRHQEFFACVDNKNIPYPECVEILTKVCLSSKIRSIKEHRIHSRTDILENLMEKLPSLKIIHVIRDPRGILTSRKPLSTIKKDPELYPENLCGDMRSDICDNINLFELNSHRVKRVIYENMAENTRRVFEEIYRFLQQTPPEIVIKRILEKSSMNRDGDAYATTRKNSTDTAYGWKKKISPEFAQSVDEHCGVVYRYAGYSKLNFTDLSRGRSYTGEGVSAREACK